MVGSGSFIGGIFRYLGSRFIQHFFVTTFPLGTFVINLSGCFLIGLFYGLFERFSTLGSDWRLFLTVGFCGGFTTFSSFTSENILLLRQGDFLYFALYTTLSVFLGLLATYLGGAIPKMI